MRKFLTDEYKYLSQYKKKSILINTTAREAISFRVLPRRFAMNIAISSFMINDVEKLIQTLKFFDEKVDYIFIDVEQKQEINLFSIAKRFIKKSKLIAIKSNDTTLESCDILVRNHFKDDLQNKNVLVIGTGNLSSKIALRMSERQANVFIKGRNHSKENTIIKGLNTLLPKYSKKIKRMGSMDSTTKLDSVISFISGQFTDESILYPLINVDTFIVDGGIGNFSSEFITTMLSKNISITRLDTRVALPYQLLSTFDYTKDFFKEIYGKVKVNNIEIVSGGLIGKKGSVIVDNIKYPSQVIGIADGSGGLKKNEQLSQTERNRIQTIKQNISTYT